MNTVLHTKKRLNRKHFKMGAVYSRCKHTEKDGCGKFIFAAAFFVAAGKKGWSEMTKKKRLLALLLAVTTMLSLVTTACAAETETPTEEMSERQAVIETLATAYDAGEYAGEWVSFDMAAYARLKNKDVKFAAEYEADAYTAISNEDATVTDLAKAEVILNSLGLNSAAVKSEGNEPINNREKLAGVTEYMTYSDAIWMLFAGEQKTVTLTAEQVTAAIDKIEQNMNEDGLLFGSYAGQVYTDIDSTGWALSAIAPFTRDEEDSFGVKEKTTLMSEKMISALSTNQGENGSYGNTYTDASVICGLCGYGINPESDERFIKGETSLASAIMSYLNTEKNGFTSGYSPDTDSWATEQAFRALLAIEMYITGDCAPLNIYSFAAKADETKPEEDPEITPPTQPEVGEDPEVIPPPVPETPSAPEDDTITVTFQMNTHEKVWLPERSVEVQKDTSVAKLIRKVFDAEEIESKGLSTGYLRSVTYQGETWGEFDAGAGSGWIYYVNGDSPRVGIGSYKLSDGDSVLLTYVADYSESYGGGSSKEEKTEEKEENSAPTFNDLNGYSWAEAAILSLAKDGVIKGVGEGIFAPGNNITRADFIILLVRAFEQKSDSEENFSDVSKNDYFAKELAIAKNNGLVNGVGNNKINPRGSIKRCDMMVMVYRTLKKLGIELKSDKVNMLDMSSVPEYAKEAVTALISNGIVNGKGGYIAPNEHTTRAEVAVLLSRILEFIK